MLIETELWMSAVDSTVWIKLQNKDGTEREVSFARKGQKIRIPSEDRERMSEVAVAPEYDAFKNGMLVQLGKDGQPLDTDDAGLSDDYLLTKVLSLRGVPLAERLRDFGEVVLRRTLVLAEQEDLPNSVVSAVRDLVAERYSVGKSSSIYQEMQAAGDVATARLG